MSEAPIEAVPHRVLMSRIDYDEVVATAQKRLEDMDAAWSSYAHNKLESHIVGRLGEVAVMTWLKDVGLNPTDTSDDGTASGDIAVTAASAPSMGSKSRVAAIEVKTSREAWWVRNGRCLNARQFATPRCDIVVWCAVQNELPGRSVLVMGWLPVATALQDVEPMFRGGHPQLRVRRPMLDCSTLAGSLDDWSEWAARPPGPYSPSATTCPACHKPTVAGICWHCLTDRMGLDSVVVRGVGSRYHWVNCSWTGPAIGPVLIGDAIISLRPCRGCTDPMVEAYSQSHGLQLSDP